ncbi:MAG: bifunctional prephenate dehydrogenase/3-phosphoshikimate 1-carboxyvinyltransferase [Pseudohongiellaceae bacterium]
MTTALGDKHILIVGLGLIGGSVARRLKQNNPQQPVTAFDKDASQLAQARDEGVIDNIAGDLAALAAVADLIVVAVPSLATGPVFEQLVKNLKPSVVITDVASVKGKVVADAGKLGRFAARFVPGHPIAGSEKSGYSASFPDLFAHRRVILTPLEETDADAIRLTHLLWRETGAEVHGMSVSRHDEVLAATSHLPHLLSYALVDVLVKQAQSEEIFRYAAGGFADFSRLASSDPVMWADIFIANSGATGVILDEYIDNLASLKAALVKQDHGGLVTMFSAARAAREKFISRYFNSSQNSQGHEFPKENEVVFVADPGGSVSGDIRVPGDKSISHRAIILAALAEGVTQISGFLEGDDSLNTLAAFREMGVTIIGPENGKVVVYGVGKNGLKEPRKPLYMGNSGTAMRLLCGLLAAQAFNSELTGDESLNGRPMGRVADPLRRMGAVISLKHDNDSPGGAGKTDTPPIRITGNAALHGIDYVMPMASAQVKSCLLLAALYAEGETRITEPAPCRDHTERMLAGFGYPVVRRDGTGVTIVSGGHTLAAADIAVPGDISSAAFFMVAASIMPGADLVLRQVGVNPTRAGIITLLRLMGADIGVSNERVAGGEPVADIRVRYAPLHGIKIPPEQIPLAIDEFPVLFVAAACAEGCTVLHGAEELRVKESDRLQVMADGLALLGIENQIHADGIAIEGGTLGGGEVDSHGDHRIAMSFAVASLRATGQIRIRHCANVSTSFPGFVELASRVGIRLSATRTGAD